MRMRRAAALALCATIAGHACVATADVPEIVTLLRESGAAVEAIGTTPGLTGWHVTRQADDDDPGYTLYVTASGHAVAGVLYDAQGVVLTVDQLRAADQRERQSKFEPQMSAQATIPDASAVPLDPDVISPEPLVLSFADLAAAHSPPPPTSGFSLGQAGPVVHVFADPTCSFSRITVARFAHAALAGKVRLTVIPVALLGADSAYQALAAVDDAAGGQAWFDRSAAEPTPVTSAAVRQNNQAHAATGLDVVPVVRTFSADGAWHDRPGAVSDVAGFLEDLR